MTSLKQQTQANKMLHQIEHDGIINKYDLMDVCGMSVNNYNAIAGWFKHRYQETNMVVEYDPKSKNWRWIGRADPKAIQKTMQIKN